MKNQIGTASGAPKPGSAVHCPWCGYPCCGGAAGHAAHGEGGATEHIANDAGLSAVPAEPEPFASGLTAVRYENVFGHRPGQGPKNG